MVHPTLRRCLFWAHLATGVVAGIVILILAVTGILMSFETQIIGRAESKIVTAKAPATGTPAGPEELVAAYKASGTSGRPTTLLLSSDPEDPAVFQAGREGRQLFHPVTGESLGKGAEGTRRFFQVVVSIHRWLTWPAARQEGQAGQGPGGQAPARGEGMGAGQGRPEGGPGEGPNQPLTWRNIGGQITAAASLVFGFLLLSGLVLWIPRKFSKKAFKAVTLPQPRLKGRARDWNWHNLAGFWAAPFLLLIILTGTIMAYPWANRLMFKSVGEEPPARQGPPGGGEGGGALREGAAQTENRPRGEGREGGERRRSRPDGADATGGNGVTMEGERRERGPRPEGGETPMGNGVSMDGNRPPREGDASAGAEGSERRRPRGEGGEGSAMGGEGGGRRGRSQQENRPIVADGLNQALDIAKQEMPAWETITLDLPGDTTKPITATLADAGRGRPDRKVKVTIDRETMTVTARENSFEKATTGGKMRQFVRWIHTGEAGGAFGQFVAALTCAATVVLVYTGFALAWRRLAGMLKNKRKKPEAAT
ncbi:PepSY-associated TM helix domain-containing protein [Luteolibacter sp. LG18]|uniref:PepSY-associated TM helix domain-containing protein n=1 Tax=Luteolibacter sp. LG18 TaxID=2819286 RepID=UPI002B281917|nr:hypothetical protein llg_05280 [Luteolibacter sp. LG18]